MSKSEFKTVIATDIKIHDDLVGAEIHEVWEYIGTTISVMEAQTSFTEKIPEYHLLSHIQGELQNIYETLGYLMDKR